VLLALVWWGCQKFDDPGTKTAEPVRRLSQEEAEGDEYEPISLWYAMFISYQVILSAGFDDAIYGVTRQLTYCVMILVGLTVFGILVGMITESFESTVEAIREGRMKAVESEHTVVLGWGEGTVRLVCQLAFLRRQWQVMNETWARYFFWWTRAQPSTVVAKGAIVIMCNTMTKAEMEEALSQGFGERGISRARTKLGRDVVCRVGDPTDVQDLQRVGAHRANAVVLQLAQADQAPDVSAVTCGMTLRTLMALRFVLYTCRSPPPWERLRIVVEMSQSAEVVNAARFTAPSCSRTIVHAPDLSLFLNSLLFTCVGQAGLAQVQLDLLSFEGASIKFRRASEFRDNGEGLVGRTLREVGSPWENAVLLGARPADAAVHDEGPSGFLVDHAHRIKAGDTLLFLCDSSMPQPALQHASTEENDWQPPLSRARSEFVRDLKVLVCGWKSEWDSPNGFLGILDEISSNARTGVALSVNFMVEDTQDWTFQDHVRNVQALEDAAARLKPWANEDNKPGGPSWIFEDRVRIAHTNGDAASFKDLLRAVSAQHYHEAIIVPPTARKELTPVAADTWVVSVILALRHTSKKLQRKPPHIVAENALDATSKLAMVPSDSQGRPAVPDFVNALAIKARALCQVLAYPEMALVLRDLFSRVPGRPLVMLVSANAFGLGGQTLTFRAVVDRVLRLQPPTSIGQADDVCLGFRTADGTLRMPPRLSEEHTFTCSKNSDKSDKIIIVTRKAPTADVYESMLRSPGDQAPSPEPPPAHRALDETPVQPF